jgi:hypothetical protein
MDTPSRAHFISDLQTQQQLKSEFIATAHGLKRVVLLEHKPLIFAIFGAGFGRHAKASGGAFRSPTS